MGRKSKQTVDYFPHVCNHKKTMFVLEQQFPARNSGYNGWFKLLETLGKSEGHFYDCSSRENWEYFCAYIQFDVDQADVFIEKLAILGAVDKSLWQEHKIIWSDNFVEGVADAYAKRKSNLPQKPSFRDENGVSGAGNPQTKLNETILNETRLFRDNTPSGETVDNSEETDPAKMTPLQIWKSHQLTKAEKAKHLAKPDCPKCGGSGFEVFMPDESSGLKPLRVPCKCWHDDKKY